MNISEQTQKIMQQKKEGGRIEYLDALRGFTMILVIINHVAAYNLGVDVFSEGNFHYYLKIFRMPLFFFVSGFVFYKASFFDDLKNLFTFFKKKFTVQIISPFIFLLCYIYYRDIPFMESIMSDTKAGYWFTFTLFNYFILYIILRLILRMLKFQEKSQLIILLFLGILLYNFNAAYCITKIINSSENILYFLGAGRLHYFLFFIIGIMIRKYFKQFEYAIDNTLIVALAAIIYFLCNILINYEGLNIFVSKNLFLLLGICGIILVFSFFRKNESYFSQNNPVSNTLKFIGKRTLDIYLLHFFFLSYDLPQIFPFFTLNSLPLLEFTVSLIMTAVVIIACLFVSSVLRIDPKLAHYLFGAKRK